MSTTSEKSRVGPQANIREVCIGTWVCLVLFVWLSVSFSYYFFIGVGFLTLGATVSTGLAVEPLREDEWARLRRKWVKFRDRHPKLFCGLDVAYAAGLIGLLVLIWPFTGLWHGMRGDYSHKDAPSTAVILFAAIGIAAYGTAAWIVWNGLGSIGILVGIYAAVTVVRAYIQFVYEEELEVK